MNKYKWNINKIRKIRDKCTTELEEAIKNNDDYTTRYLLEYIPMLYSEILRSYNIDKRDIFDLIELEKTPNTEDEKLDFFWTRVMPFINYEAADIILDNPLDLSTIDNFTPDVSKLIVLNNDELFEVINTLFKNIPNQKLYQKFLEITNPAKQLINIQYSQNFYGYLGTTMVDPYSHISYGNIIRNNTSQDIITLFHEIFHMIVRRYEHVFSNDTKSVIYKETEGYFANMIITDLIKQIGLDVHPFLQFQIYETVNNINNYKRVITSLNNLYSKAHDPASYIDFDLETNLNSIFSFQTALDFYYLYQKDPEETINKILNLDLLTGENIKKELSNNEISFFQDNNANLRKHFKKIKKLNGII